MVLMCMGAFLTVRKRIGWLKDRKSKFGLRVGVSMELRLLVCDAAVVPEIIGESGVLRMGSSMCWWVMIYIQIQLLCGDGMNSHIYRRLFQLQRKQLKHGIS